MIFALLVPLALAAPCGVPGEPARWAAEVCPKGDCAHPKFADACAEAKFWKAKWCAAYIKGGGQTTPAGCLEDRALIPAGVEPPVTARDVRVDGQPCKQDVSYFAPGRHKEAKITCAGRRDGVYERWAENGSRYIQGGYFAGAPGGTWSFFTPDNRLNFKVIFDQNHAVERAPKLAPPSGGAYELFAADGPKSGQRLDADGKITIIRAGTRAETYLDAEAYAALQAAAKSAWAAPELLKPCAGKAATIALRHAADIRRVTCAARAAPLLKLVAARATAPGTLAGDVLALTAVLADDPPGVLDFPRGPKP